MKKESRVQDIVDGIKFFIVIACAVTIILWTSFFSKERDTNKKTDLPTQ